MVVRTEQPEPNDVVGVLRLMVDKRAVLDWQRRTKLDPTAPVKAHVQALGTKDANQFFGARVGTIVV